MRRIAPVVVCVALLVAACGDDDSTTSTGSTDTTSTTSTSSTTTSTTSTTVPAAELPGERIDLFPYEDAILGVVAVAADDTLNVRTGPGIDFAVAFELAPLATGIVATGHNRQIEGGSIWAEITFEGATGWANTAFLSHPDGTDDITTQLYPTPADLPSAGTMLELGRRVGADRASDDPPSVITVVDGPSVGDLGEITVDVTGYPDDSIFGERLVIFAEPAPDGGSFSVRSVESTLLCRRGVSEGSCV